ncbi:hypothetical protein HNR23_002698 [Nocardiopsis mwathae]|uniref:Uncharacterized protein n=1 Tax=Nocardiopsis mwathae TaxID=1472723 RepID=A0A7X0D5U7_9ACTN|nr:hypothetical protein [Nocardiopsis mwathae]
MHSVRIGAVLRGPKRPAALPCRPRAREGPGIGPLGSPVRDLVRGVLWRRAAATREVGDRGGRSPCGWARGRADGGSRRRSSAPAPYREAATRGRGRAPHVSPGRPRPTRSDALTFVDLGDIGASRAVFTPISPRSTEEGAGERSPWAMAGCVRVRGGRIWGSGWARRVFLDDPGKKSGEPGAMRCETMIIFGEAPGFSDHGNRCTRSGTPDFRPVRSHRSTRPQPPTGPENPPDSAFPPPTSDDLGRTVRIPAAASRSGRASRCRVGIG